jgi:hypothetical protein
MHDFYGGLLDFDVLPVVPKDKVKAPWNELLLIDLCKIRINCILLADKDYVEKWIRAVAQYLQRLFFEIRFLTHLT